MNKAERREAIAELEAKIEGVDRTPVEGVATADGIKPSWRATSVTDFGRYDAPKHVQDAIAAQEADEALAMQAWVDNKRAEQDEKKITRRSPLTRADILTGQLAEHYHKFGNLPDSIMREIQGEFWKQGAVVSMEEIKAYAGTKLEQAARQHEQKYGHRNEGVQLVGGMAS